MTPLRNAVRSLAALAALALAPGCRKSAQSASDAGASPPLVTDALALAPHGTRLLLAADLARLRGASATGPLAQALLGREGSCERRVLSKVRRAVAFGRSPALDDLAFAFEGPITREEVTACALQLRGERGFSNERYRGVPLLRARDDRPRELLPAAEPAELAVLPGATLLAGPSGAVRAMIDRAWASADAPGSLPPALRALTDRLDEGYALAAAALVAPSDQRRASVLNHVEGVALGAWPSDRLRVSAVLACDDFDSPRAVADGLGAARDDVLGRLRFAALARPLRDARVERRATDVRVSLDATAEELSVLALAARALSEDGASLLREQPADADAGPGTADAAPARD